MRKIEPTTLFFRLDGRTAREQSKQQLGSYGGGKTMGKLVGSNMRRAVSVVKAISSKGSVRSFPAQCRGGEGWLSVESEPIERARSSTKEHIDTRALFAIS